MSFKFLERFYYLIISLWLAVCCSKSCHTLQTSNQRSIGHNNFTETDGITTHRAHAERTSRSNENSTLIVNGTCHLLNSPNISVVLTDSLKNRLNITVRSKVPVFSKSEVKCKPGYALADGNRAQQSICYPPNEWIPPIKPCLKTCRTLQPENVDLSCYREKVKVPCTMELVSGSRVRPQCKSFCSPEKLITYRELRCQQNGKWDKEFYNCVPDCGFLSDEYQITYAYLGNETSIEKSPWHVAIYRISTNFTLICGGTLVSTRMVITAAHCIYDKNNSAPFSPTDYEIIVGRYTRNYTKDDSFQKKHKIREFKIHKRFDPVKSGHYGYHIAVVILNQSVELTRYALPACVDWIALPGFQPGNGTLGKLVGWGIINASNIGGMLSDVLLSVDLPFVSYEACLGKLKPLPSDQFCAGSNSGPGARRGDSGGGLIFKDRKNNRYYLRGIVSTGKSATATTSSYTSFTDISYHLTWLDEVRRTVEASTINNVQSTSHKVEAMSMVIIKGSILSNRITNLGTIRLGIHINATTALSLMIDLQHFRSKSSTAIASKPTESSLKNNICDIPRFLINTTTIQFIGDREKEAQNISFGSKVPENSKLDISCKPGYGFPRGEKTQQSVCYKEAWLPSLNRCQKICSVLHPINVNLTCFHEDVQVDCNKDLVNGTRVQPRCKPQYHQKDIPYSREINCKADGDWDEALFECALDDSDYNEYGISYEVSVRIVGLLRTSLGDHPWVAALYDNSTYPKINVLCVGTLISDMWLVTSGTCAEKLKIYSWTFARLGDLDLDPDKDDGANPVDVPIDEIITHPNYTIRQVVDNIALLRFKNKVKFSYSIRPILLPRENIYRSDVYYRRKKFYMTGWGTIELSGFDTVLQKVPLNHVPNEDCIKSYAEQQTVKVDHRVLCSRESCIRDSGSPLMLLQRSVGYSKRKFILIGILATGPIDCVDGRFPNLSRKITWIKDENFIESEYGEMFSALTE